jgi:hypothetical protein
MPAIQEAHRRMKVCRARPVPRGSLGKASGAVTARLRVVAAGPLRRQPQKHQLALLLFGNNLTSSLRQGCLRNR